MRECEALCGADCEKVMSKVKLTYQQSKKLYNVATRLLRQISNFTVAK